MNQPHRIVPKENCQSRRARHITELYTYQPRRRRVDGWMCVWCVVVYDAPTSRL